MFKSKRGKILAIVLIALTLSVSGIAIFTFKERNNMQLIEPYKVMLDESKKTISFRGDNYIMVIDYDSKFKISSYQIKKEGTNKYSDNILAPDKGIYVKCHYISDNEYNVSSLSLEKDPTISVNDRTISIAFVTGLIQYDVNIILENAFVDLTIQRAFSLSNDTVIIVEQGFPSINIEQDHTESIRWKRSGANFWIGGKAEAFPNFLSAGSGYGNNIVRGMEDITFTLLGNETAVSFNGEVFDRTNERPFLTEVQRYENDNKKHLEMDVSISPLDRKIAYATGTEDGWPTGAGGLQGKLGPQGTNLIRKYKAEPNQKDKISFRITAESYSSYYDLGVLKGINESLLSSALNDYGRLMIMDWNMGTTVENPNKFFEIPALEQHWNTNILGILRDDAALNAQKQGLKIIRDRLQAKDGHIASPYVGMGLVDSWGSSYSDTELGYVISVCDLYNLTGDRVFLEEMHESISKALEYTYNRYFDKEANVIKNLHSWDFNDKYNIPQNDYWEHSGGKYNGYTTAMYYDAICKLAVVEEILGNQEKVDEYNELANKVKKGFNKIFWSEDTNTFLYGTGNYDICYLPVQGASMKSNLVTPERKKLIVRSIEKEHAAFNLPFHVMNIRDILNPNQAATQELDFGSGMMGMNGGWYGAPDGDFYSGFPTYGDRTLIPRYINGFTEMFSKTGFIGASVYLRDGVTPADYGWMDCMPTFVNIVWGLYTYGYGFQPSHDCLYIAPFIDKTMEGSVVKYRWRQSDLVVKYNSIYSFTLSTSSLPTPICIKFINQTAGKTYTVKVNGTEKQLQSDSNGDVKVYIEQTGEINVEIVNPDSEVVIGDGTNVALNAPISPSSTYNNNLPQHWTTCLTNGEYDNYWAPDEKDSNPWVRIELGSVHDLQSIKIYFDKQDRYYYTIEGTNDPTFSKWSTLVNTKSKGKSTDSNNVITESIDGKYSYVRVVFYKVNKTSLRLTEIEVY